MQRPDPDALLSEITGEQWAEWCEFYQLEPWGDARADVRALWVASMAVSPYRKKGASPPRFEDYFPHLATRQREQSPEEMKAALMAWTVALGGKVE